MRQEVLLGFSTCPNDTFIFHPLVHRKIDTGDIVFRERLGDVEELNQMALRGELDVTKVSCHAVGHLLGDYCLLRSGGALGKGCGPLVVAREKISIEELKGKRIAIPGRLTTAFLLLCLYNPELANHSTPMPFHRIMESVKSGETDAGLIIHEGRFTYPLYGLTEVMDLGKWWEEETGLPIPLGGIVARRSLGKERLRIIERLIAEGIKYSRSHPEEPVKYIRLHAQEMSDRVIRQHIELYVNEFSTDVGEEGQRAIETLIVKARKKGLLPETAIPVFC
ncbi:1,4-dihydroxy-6-naphtoate synthase [hydrothermal vent metagenome]|uniref:1,4-dihydroxy-6-naphtoate synthase n=1 Tax=hydrothermal vent metagenome TaxID=652676 RepID=A0A3B1DAX1_9ZZZZ